MRNILSFLLTIILSVNSLPVYAPNIKKENTSIQAVTERYTSKKMSENKLKTKKSRGPIPIVEASKKINIENILFIGNSLICGINAVTEEHSFIAEIGITAKVLRTGGYYERLQDFSLETVIIGLGTNELGWFGEKNFKDELDILITEIKTQNRKSNIILMTIPPISESRSLSDEYFNNKNVATYNEYIKDIATSHNLLLIDSTNFFGNILSDNDTEDGIHLKPHKYKEWYEYILTEIEKINENR